MKWKDISELNNEKVSKEVLVKVGLFLAAKQLIVQSMRWGCSHRMMGKYTG